MKGIKALLFDVDETLIDASSGLEAAHRAVAGKLLDFLTDRGVHVGGDTIRSRLKELDDRMNLETRYDRDEWWPELLSELGFRERVPGWMVEELTKLYWNTYSDASTPYPDTEPTLNYLRGKGYKLGLVTDTDGKPGIKEERLKRLDFLKIFDAVVISGEDTRETKPNPEPFLLAALRLGLRAKECAVVGDKPFTDIKGGRAAGMLTVWVKRREWGVEEPADFTVKSLSELREIF
jgi:putative hydrolase of the HAD superfamily